LAATFVHAQLHDGCMTVYRLYQYHDGIPSNNLVLCPIKYKFQYI